MVNLWQFMFKEIYEYGVELDLIYITRWQKCPILSFLLTPHACDISKLFPAGRVQRNLRRVVTHWYSVIGYKKAWKNDSFCVAKAIVLWYKSYRFSSWKLSFYTLKAMLWGWRGRKMVKKHCVFRFFTFNFILVCVFSLTKIKRRNHQNVLFYVSIV